MRIYKVYQQNTKYGVLINLPDHLNIRMSQAFLIIIMTDAGSFGLMIFF